MIRKILMVGAAAAMPVGALAMGAGIAGASTTYSVGTATASCTTSGGKVAFKVPLGVPTSSIPTSQWVQPPAGPQTTKVSKITLTCTSSAVTGTFTGSAAGVITSASSDYALTGLSGGALPDSGSLTIKWKAPSGQKFSSKSSVLSFTDIIGGTGACVANPLDTCGTFTVPGTVGSATITGAFAGSDGGASSTTSSSTTQDETTLLTQGVSKKGVKGITLATGTGTLG